MLKICEIYTGLSGECATKGTPTLFIRLHGCNLSCSYCDSKYANKGSYLHFTYEDLMRLIIKSTYHYTHPKHILFTGGEPLFQFKELREVINSVDPFSTVEIETNGSILLKDFRNQIEHPNIMITMDYKLESSGMEGKMLFDNFIFLQPQDQLKFCVKTMKDLNRMKDIVEKYLVSKFQMWCSPVNRSKRFLQKCEEFIIVNKLPVKFSIQQHKIIWGNKRKR